jgi:molybdenum cofactor biosynthesis enzyme MoaA
VNYLTQLQINDWPCDELLSDGGREAMAGSIKALSAVGQFGAQQQMGRRWAVGCVALEITQRCNLDCHACYLSEHSEAVKDLPLAQVFERIDAIAAHYGPLTDVQITGGDPTLRQVDELVAIVARVASLGLRPTLMTNGIKATPELLQRLADAGLCDVAFHVDTTQDRKAYSTEAELHPLRDRYAKAAHDAGLSVMFNTTLHAGNYHELPSLVAYFVRRSNWVRTASFQLQADTGRGVLRERDDVITMENTIAKMSDGAKSILGFSASAIGHTACTRYVLTACIGDRVVNLFDDPAFIADVQSGTADIAFHRDAPVRTLCRFAVRILSRPILALRGLKWLSAKLVRNGAALIGNRLRVETLSFVIHDFMDARCLDPERIEACAFKVMTVDGPLSMCMVNAKRDDFILRPLVSGHGEASSYWDPLTGSQTAQPVVVDVAELTRPLKRLKGRARQAALDKRSKSRERAVAS